MPTDNSDLIEAARTEADLCKNEGADDIASLLWKLADALARAAVAPQPAPPRLAEQDAAIVAACGWPKRHPDHNDRAIYMAGWHAGRAAPASGDTPAIPKGDAEVDGAMLDRALRRSAKVVARGAAVEAAGDAVPVALTDEQCARIWHADRRRRGLLSTAPTENELAGIRAGYTAAPAEKKG